MSNLGQTVTLAQLWQRMMRPLSAHIWSSGQASKVSMPSPLFHVEKWGFGGQISARYTVSVLESRLSFSTNSHVNHLLGS